MFNWALGKMSYRKRVLRAYPAGHAGTEYSMVLQASSAVESMLGV